MLAITLLRAKFVRKGLYRSAGFVYWIALTSEGLHLSRAEGLVAPSWPDNSVLLQGRIDIPGPFRLVLERRRLGPQGRFAPRAFH